MKKKASLLISGITTVAMLAVAVGSFAAWDTLTPSTTPEFSATSGSPKVVDVVSAQGGDANSLVPESAAIGSGEATEITLGTFTPSVKKDDTLVAGASNATGVKLILNENDISISSVAKNSINKDAFTISVKKGGTAVSDLSDLISGQEYTVTLKFAKTAADDTFWTTEAKTLYSNINDLKVACKVTASTVTN